MDGRGKGEEWKVHIYHRKEGGVCESRTTRRIGDPYLRYMGGLCFVDYRWNHTTWRAITGTAFLPLPWSLSLCRSLSLFARDKTSRAHGWWYQVPIKQAQPRCLPVIWHTADSFHDAITYFARATSINLHCPKIKLKVTKIRWKTGN